MGKTQARISQPLLDAWPVPRPDDWLAQVNQPQPADELTRLRTSVTRGRPYGGDDWVVRMCRELGLEFTLHARGPRPGRRPDERATPGLNPAAGLS